MAERIVVDASVAVACLREEPRTDDARDAVRRWARAGATLCVPSHFWVEVLNVLVRRHGWDPAEAIEGMLVLDRMELRTTEVDRPLLLLAAGQMEARGLSAYDAIYLSLAVATEARLATLDERLAEAAGDRALRLGPGPRLVSEPVASYARSDAVAPWAHSAVVGAHIAELRTRARAASGAAE